MFDLIGFDADDTLWENEYLFYNAQKRLGEILKNYSEKPNDVLLQVEKQNLSNYGYGIKGFILSLIETSLKLSKGKIENRYIEEFLDLGKEMLSEPVKIIDGVESTLKSLSHNHNLILITKGDLLNQEKKIKNSNLSQYFNFIEIVSEKNEQVYLNILGKYNFNPSKFLMVGNSLNSDILPVLKIGGMGLYIPHELTWDHEKVDKISNILDYVELESIFQIIPWLQENYNKK